MLSGSERKSLTSADDHQSSRRFDGDNNSPKLTGNNNNKSRGKPNLKSHQTTSNKLASNGNGSSGRNLRQDFIDEREKFLTDDKSKTKSKAKLAKQETIEELDESEHHHKTGSCRRLVKIIMKKSVFIPLLLIAFIAAIYCLPYVDIQPDTAKKLPTIPFDFEQPPLKASRAGLFKAEKLFKNQIQGPESVATDSAGNMYMAIEGGFVLYAHLNKSSPLRRAFQEISDSPLLTTVAPRGELSFAQDGEPNGSTDLIRIAELNGIKQMPYETRQDRRRARDEPAQGSWRRECQTDEKLYGPNLYSTVSDPLLQSDDQRDEPLPTDASRARHFRSNVILSRCSKPLGIRLSPDESSLYIIDTLNGLFKINLLRADNGRSGLRQVSKLIDFRGRRSLPVLMLNAPVELPMATSSALNQSVDVSMRAIDDLAIDWGAGASRSDVVYLSLASQRWNALSFLYDLFEAQPTGRVLRYDVGANQLVVMDPKLLSNVRYSTSDLDNVTSLQHQAPDSGSRSPRLGIGAPRLDENDVFDERPLHFPNGIEITDDRTAILIAETSSKRILKHYIRGPRIGQTDLWAWTPNFPDNIRRGADKHRETYWVVGCGHEPGQVKIDQLQLLQPWPMIRKLVLKSIYLFGWLIEKAGGLFKSPGIRDYGYSFKIGHSICENSCHGMMIFQYDKFGNILRSIHSQEFPNDLHYYSQVNEVIDPDTNKHVLYLGSPSYSYVTKLTLPPEPSTYD